MKKIGILSIIVVGALALSVADVAQAGRRSQARNQKQVQSGSTNGSRDQIRQTRQLQDRDRKQDGSCTDGAKKETRAQKRQQSGK